MTRHVMVHTKQSGGVIAQPQLALPISEEQQGEIRVYRMVLPFTPPSKNVYDQWLPTWKSGAKRKWTKALLDEFEAVMLPKGALKVGMAATLVFPTKARRDTQNYSNCLWHWVPDALVKYGCIEDDTPEYVEIGPNWGIKMAFDARTGVPKAKRSRTHLAITVQMKPGA